ncbi:FadR/GntR family transcriptional regulator [Chitinophaga rhizosphaerae]|uniref:FadR/GntR family transcriptional regulator n=1 Tax=Chitinophaga rhizosphaerae TaxID=1864947 RepID=UPI001F0B7CC3|nr:FadR/GntR family transcriptional regulator [Chitinophaga rhizosphaerae]
MTKQVTILKRNSLADDVAAGLQDMITGGTYAVGDRLPSEPELMLLFGVGRSSVREAVRLLVNAGMLRVQQGQGTFVTSSQPLTGPLGRKLHTADYQELNEVRLLLEVKIAEKAALHRTREDLARMKTFLRAREKFAKAGNVDATMQADVHFHTSIAVASKNSIMLELYQTIATHMLQSFKDRHKDTGDFELTQYMHKALLDAIADQDAEQALVWATRISTHSR